jgi:hypothetical protein
MEFIKPFGPQIGHTQLSDEDNNLLLEIIEKNKYDSSKIMKTVTGLFEDFVENVEYEFDVLDSLKPKLLNTLSALVAEYASNTVSQYNSIKNPFDTHHHDLKCIGAWCCDYQPYEGHPVHIHPLTDLVCLIFPKVEIQNTKFNVGSINFEYGHHLNRFGVHSHMINPKSKDVYIFPADLLHYALPIRNQNDTRISVNLNFVFNDLFYKKRKLFGQE